MAEKLTIEARIAHFLRVSEDPGATQAERDTAGKEAERLLAKHAIDRLTLDVDGARRAEREPIETGELRVAGGKGTVALDVVLGLSAVARSLGLYPYYSDRRTPVPWEPDDGPHVLLKVSGFRSDLTLAMPLLASLEVQGTIAVRAWWRGDPQHRLIPRYDALLSRCAFVQAFGVGAAERLKAKRDEAVSVAATGTALVVASREEAVQTWVQDNLRLQQKRDRRSFSGYGRGQGYAAGLRSSGAAQRAVAPRR